MRRLVFLLCLAFLVSSLSVGCSSKKRSRKKSDSDNTEQQANANSSKRDSAEAKGEDDENADAADNDSKNDIGGNANAQARRPSGMRNGDNLSIGGGPPANTSRPPAGINQGRGRRANGMRNGDNLSIGGGPGGVIPAGGRGNNARPQVRRPGGMRPGDNLAIGGGNQPPIAAGGRREPGRGGSQPNDPAGAAFAGGGLLNGFYPQPSTGGTAFAADGTLPNGFFPQSMGGEASGPVVTAPLPKQRPSVEFRESARIGFQERDNAKAMSNLWGYMVANDENIKKFPLKYYPGMKETSGALRFGVGVIYSNRSEDKRPLVIGDPEGFREFERTSSRGRGGSRNARGSGRRGAQGGAPGGMESLGGNSRAPAASSGGDSDYMMVDVEHPEGFLLYYTGDLGDKFLDRMASRIHHPEGYYGKVYQEFVTDYSNEKKDEQETAEFNRPRNLSINDQRRSQRARDNLSVGGGAGARGRRSNRGGGGRAAADEADISDRLKRLMTNEEADTPPSDTMGLLMPGVFLVGEGKRDQLFERSKNLGLDVLIIFSTRVSNARTSVGAANIKIYALNGEKPEQLASSRSLKSDKVAEQRDGLTDASRDPVELALNELFTNSLDENLKGTEIPEILRTDPLKLKERLDAKVASKPTNVLPLMHEILSYLEQGFIKQRFAEQKLNQLLGGVMGETFLEADEDGRAKVLKKFVLRASGILGATQ